MAKTELTLQNRIATLVIFLSFIFISTFTFIQINNQIANINRYNTDRTHLATMWVKIDLENIVKQVDPRQTAAYLQADIEKMQEAQIVNSITVFDAEGRIVASTDIKSVGTNIPINDTSKIPQLKTVFQENRWFVYSLDKLHKQLYIYIALGIDKQNISYIAKLSLPLDNITGAFLQVYKPVIFVSIIVILVNILFAYLFSKTVIGPIKVLNETTKIIAAGDLSVRTNISTGDELQELGVTFNDMTEELIKMKARAENANPLTKLPGNIVIREEIEKRIKENSRFTVIYIDLDNFKAFNDRYGIAKGDEAIKLTAEIFKETISAGLAEFVGHEGGDDFVLLTRPEKTRDLSERIIGEFDQRIRSLYTQEDIARGFITAQARDGSTKQFPIMTISLAGVSNTRRAISSYPEVTNIMAEVKKKAKSMEGSKFVQDERVA